MIFLENLWLFLPAAVANSVPVFARAKMFRKIPNPPLDFGARLGGKPVLGGGKTFVGTALGLAAGTAVGALQGSWLLGLALAAGALAGDIVGAFFKRRLGMARGTPFFPVDQLDFVAGAVLASLPFGIFGWTPTELALLCLIAVPLHRLAGIIGHRIKVKREPW